MIFVMGNTLNLKHQLLVAAIVILTPISGCQKPKGFPNPGSCFGAVTGAMAAIRTYLKDTGTLPFVEGDPIKALREAGVQEEDLQLVAYANDRNISISTSSSRTVILICRRPHAPDNGKYVSLLSGDILYVPNGTATLGMPLRENLGRKVDHR